MDAKKLRDVLEKHKKWLNGEDDGERADLSGSNLGGSDLSGSDLSGSDLSGSNLRGSDLSGSDLRESDLSGSNLRGSDLSGSDLSGSDLRGSNLRGSDLRGSNLRGSDLRESNLRGSDLRGSNLSGANLDFACWPLWCGSLDVIVDKWIAAQLAYHFCRIICDDGEVKAAQKALASLANQFHRVDECGRIEE